MAKRRSRKRAPDNRLRLILLVIVALLVGYYWVTGNDPLGIFRIPAATPVPTTMAGQGGAWWTVYFTQPGASDNRSDIAGTVAEKLVDRINGAEESIHIAAFEFNLTPIAQALITAHQRGVAVQWVTDNEHGIEADAEEGHGQFALLQEAGIEIKDDARSALMHNKFWIFDEQAVWTGSTNVSVNDVFRNNNNVIVVESPAVAAIYEREFAELWAGQFGPTSPSTVEQQATSMDGTPVQMYFAAEDEAISHLAPLIANAQQRIRFMAFSFTHDVLGDALLARAEAGVDIQGIFETRGSEVETSELPRLFCARLPVRQDGNPGTFHHKVFVIDEAIVVTGSLNFSENADNSNDENVIILNNRDIATLYLQEFDRRWAEAVQPEAAAMHCS